MKKDEKMKKFIIRDMEKNTEFVLPVTPSNFEISYGINFETINIHDVGEVTLAGHRTLSEIKIECMLPANKYSFNHSNVDLDPYSYIKKLEDWCKNRTLLRFVVTKTNVNRAVKIKEIQYGEKDGTKDVYATITLKEYKVLKPVKNNKTGNSSRTDEKASKTISYAIKKGDTLYALCKKHYGNPLLDKKLASYNNIKNPNLIIAGKTIKIPDKL